MTLTVLDVRKRLFSDRIHPISLGVNVLPDSLSAGWYCFHSDQNGCFVLGLFFFYIFFLPRMLGGTLLVSSCSTGQPGCVWSSWKPCGSVSPSCFLFLTAQGEMRGKTMAVNTLRQHSFHGSVAGWMTTEMIFRPPPPQKQRSDFLTYATPLTIVDLSCTSDRQNRQWYSSYMI